MTDRGAKMQIVEKHVSSGRGEVFDLDEFLARPLYAHLAHSSTGGPRESPVWFSWDGEFIWIIGGSTFPANLRHDPRCALGIVDWDSATGKSHHVAIRGRAEVMPFDLNIAKAILRRYFGPDESRWDPRFDYSIAANHTDDTLVRITRETVVMRDQSYKVS